MFSEFLQENPRHQNQTSKQSRIFQKLMMQFFTIFAFLFAVCAFAQNQTTGKLGDAVVVGNNPPMASYIAHFSRSDMSKLKGKVTAISGKDGKGVNFSLTVQGLPKEGGPFSKFLLLIFEIEY
jgi:hypothetical protein